VKSRFFTNCDPLRGMTSVTDLPITFVPPLSTQEPFAKPTLKPSLKSSSFQGARKDGGQGHDVRTK